MVFMFQINVQYDCKACQSIWKWLLVELRCYKYRKYQNIYGKSTTHHECFVLSSNNTVTSSCRCDYVEKWYEDGNYDIYQRKVILLYVGIKKLEANPFMS